MSNFYENFIANAAYSLLFMYAEFELLSVSDEVVDDESSNSVYINSDEYATLAIKFLYKSRRVTEGYCTFNLLSNLNSEFWGHTFCACVAYIFPSLHHTVFTS